MLKGLPKYQIWGKINQITLTRLNKAKRKKATGLLRQADGRYDLPKSLRPHSPSSFNRKKKKQQKSSAGIDKSLQSAPGAPGLGSAAAGGSPSEAASRAKRNLGCGRGRRRSFQLPGVARLWRFFGGIICKGIQMAAKPRGGKAA